MPPVQTNVTLCLQSLVKSRYCPGSLGAPVLSLRGSIEEATARGTMLSLPQCPLPEPGSPSPDLLCDLRQATCPLRGSLLPQSFFVAQASLELEGHLPLPPQILGLQVNATA